MGRQDSVSHSNKWPGHAQQRGPKYLGHPSATSSPRQYSSTSSIPALSADMSAEFDTDRPSEDNEIQNREVPIIK
ncbi:hypothetical protein PanWU01x14_063410 [Parasponia andersonii]|uniref:Uncharacterized protein n=1 Tax=Parasponia andersonii TaxID=3476 RepID=A0A2P5DHS8_PARAD|nr:hypothetical protein PanWU01x14_063410 [Parasponia andersonii]